MQRDPDMRGIWYTIRAAARAGNVSADDVQTAVAREELAWGDPREPVIHAPEFARWLRRRALRAIRRASRIGGSGTPGATPR